MVSYSKDKEVEKYDIEAKQRFSYDSSLKQKSPLNFNRLGSTISLSDSGGQTGKKSQKKKYQ